jgi:hypothetical protein
VTHCGRICFKGRKVNLSRVFAGQNVGVTQVGDWIRLVTFMQSRAGNKRRQSFFLRSAVEEARVACGWWSGPGYCRATGASRRGPLHRAK